MRMSTLLFLLYRKLRLRDFLFNGGCDNEKYRNDLGESDESVAECVEGDNGCRISDGCFGDFVCGFRDCDRCAMEIF